MISPSIFPFHTPARGCSVFFRAPERSPAISSSERSGGTRTLMNLRQGPNKIVANDRCLKWLASLMWRVWQGGRKRKWGGGWERERETNRCTLRSWLSKCSSLPFFGEVIWPFKPVRFGLFLESSYSLLLHTDEGLLKILGHQMRQFYVEWILHLASWDGVSRR